MTDEITDRPIVRNPVVDRIADGSVALGLSVRLARSGEIARIARLTDHDFLYIDTQHAPFDVETIGHIAQTSLACGVAPIVRTRGADDSNLSLLLDMGVSGLVIPDVESAAQAEQVVQATKFAPIGSRSVGGGLPHFDYGPVPAAVAAPALNAATVIICMIESVAGLEDLDRIGAVPGFDGLYLGMNDMLLSMGRPSEFDSPEILEALDRVVAVAAANGKFAGCGGVKEIDHQMDAIRRGVRFLTTQADAGYIISGARAHVGEIHQRMSADPELSGALPKR